LRALELPVTLVTLAARGLALADHTVVLLVKPLDTSGVSQSLLIVHLPVLVGLFRGCEPRSHPAQARLAISILAV
jgi:hypothetical protein